MIEWNGGKVLNQKSPRILFPKFDLGREVRNSAKSFLVYATIENGNDELVRARSVEFRSRKLETFVR